MSMLKLLPIVILMLYAWPVHANKCKYFDDFKDNKNGTITDFRDGLVWQRCAVGQTWTGTACKGDGVGMTWWEAMEAAKKDQFLSKSDWRLPTLTEMKSITGKHTDCMLGENAKITDRAVSLLFASAEYNASVKYYRGSAGFVEEHGEYVGIFWSSTIFTSSGAWMVYLQDGSYVSVGRQAPVPHVRLVRGGSPEGQQEFEHEYKEMSSSPYWPGKT